MRVPPVSLLLGLGFTFAPRPAAASATPPNSVAVVATVEEYHEGFRRNAPTRVTAVLGPSFTMFNGNHSGVARAPGRSTCT